MTGRREKGPEKGKKNMNAQTAIMNEDEWNDYLLFQMKKEHMADDEEWAKAPIFIFKSSKEILCLFK